MLSGANEEKRDYIRMQVEGDVICKEHVTGRIVKGSALDLSHTGVRFETPELMTEGMTFAITISIGTGGAKPLQADFIVRRVQKDRDKYIVSGEMSNVK